MTQRVDNLLRQVSALKNYLEDHANDLTDKQALKVGLFISSCWDAIERRRDRR